MTGFDRVVVVDWSASATPSPARPSKDAIWIGVADADGVRASYHRTRADAEAALPPLIVQGRVLLGFDFPMGYPAGFAQRLTGHAGAAAVWNWLAARVVDGPKNANNRFVLADQINAQCAANSGGTGPFWGRPRGLALPHVPERKQVDYAALGLPERRRVETVVPRAQPVWKLYTTGSVGSQALMGLPMIARLAAMGATAWPFDNPDTRLVLAEVYPSLIDRAVGPAVRAGQIKDSAQVQLLAQALWRLAQGPGLAALLADVPDWPGRADEGWILGAGHDATLLEALCP